MKAEHLSEMNGAGAERELLHMRPSSQTTIVTNYRPSNKDKYQSLPLVHKFSYVILTQTINNVIGDYP